MSNSIGNYYKITTFGESHGKALGCIIDGCPAGIEIKKSYIQKFLDIRRPGKSKYVTTRKEKDSVSFVSGIFNNQTTGTPICLIVKNYNKISNDYKNIENLYRPGHADFTYFIKYGTRDHRGGGRSSARTTLSIVIAGSIARKILNDFFNIKFNSYVNKVGKEKIKVFNERPLDQLHDFGKNKSLIKIKDLIRNTTKNCDSLGSRIKLIITGLLPGIGEPLYEKLESELIKGLIGINAIKSISIGNGFNIEKLKGSENNDEIRNFGFLSNNSGGILGGISTGQDIILTLKIKPTPSVFKKQRTINTSFKNKLISIKGRHDPCVGLRAPVIIESISSVVILNLIMKQRVNLFY
ncbi:chorismate synthase [Candidatus Vidania fulgoroideorum]